MRLRRLSFPIWVVANQEGMLFPRLLLEDLHITYRGLEGLRGRQMRGVLH